MSAPDDRDASPPPKPPAKPSDHPQFFRFPAPPGPDGKPRSRESTIRLDADGRFFHEGAPVEHAGLAAAFHGWISRHPDDGRYILTNGYDWTYFTVDDAPYVVRSLRREGDALVLTLSDGSEEPWNVRQTRIGDGGALYTVVKRSTTGGPYEAKFSRHAQAALAPYLVEDSGGPAVRMGETTTPIG